MDRLEESRSRLPWILGAVAIAIGLAALVYALPRSAPEKAPLMASAPAATPQPAASGYTAASTNPDVKAALLADLPHAPASAPLDPYCADYSLKPQSSAGRAAAAKGWLIAGEARLGPLTAVLIVGGYEPGTSAVCYARNGNIALYDGARLVAIVYAAKGSDVQIGSFEQIGETLRIGTSTPIAPFGDLTIHGRDISFGPISASDSVCGGRRTVPNVYGLPIVEARRKLIANGWKPVASSEEVWALGAELRAQGVVEVSSCSGTGYGFCAFEYAAGGDRLDLTTTDDDAEVGSYSVECH
jgi:hypothetical protein